MTHNYFHKYESKEYYHLYNHACGDKNIFIDYFDYVDFKEKYEKYFSKFFDLMAYCLMPNHFHLLIRVKEEKYIKEEIAKDNDSKAKEKYLTGIHDLNTILEDQFRRLFSAYSMKYNNKHKTTGQLFLNRHKRILLRSDTKIKYMLCYIHHNPIHHKFRKNYGEWVYCSYQKYLKNDEAFKDHLQYFGGIDNFLKLHQVFKIDKSKEGLNFNLD
jgi:putative transposase